jgi:phosphoribosylformylglycinamidine synthase
VHVKAANTSTAITHDLSLDRAYKIPIAHGEGRFYAPQETIDSILANDQVLFRYASEDGITSEEFNPNGSVNNIAGICNKGRNVFGMMPHPERAADSEIANEDGKLFFESLLKNC